MNSKKLSTLATLLTLFLTLPGTAVHAQVRDEAAFFSKGAVDQLNQTIERIKSQSGKTLVIETYQVLPADVRDQYTKENSTPFFDKWLQSRGRANRADVMVLMTRDPSHLVVGESEANRASGTFTPADHSAVSAQLLSAFKARQFDEGILAAANTIEKRLAVKGEGRSGSSGAQAPPSAPQQNPRSGETGSAAPPAYPSGNGGASRSTGGMGIGSLVCVGIAVIGLFMLVRKIFSRAGQQQQQPPFGSGPFSPGAQGNYPPPLPPGAQYGQGGGGGFGRGVAGGLLGGVLGGVIGNQVFGQHHQSADSASADNATPGPSPLDTDSSSSAGGDFGDSSDIGGGGGDFGGGGDSSSGGDF